MKKIVFVCTGNTCRSAMAEGMLTAMADAHGWELEAASCGLFAMGGSGATKEARDAARAHGADLSHHTAQPATAPLLEEADQIYCMTQGHLQELTRRFPQCGEKARCLGERDIIDPWGGPPAVYEQTARMIEKALLRLFGQEQRGKEK